MKTFLFIFFCFYSIAIFSKDCNINKFNRSGQKQGLWVEYDSLDVEGYSVSAQMIPDSTGKSDSQYEIATKYERIKHRGIYNNGVKTGLWQVYKPKNRLWMKVEYDDYGLRTKIEIFYSNGKLLYSCDKLDIDFFLIKEFSKKGSLLKEIRRPSHFVNRLTETKLYTLGF